MESQPQNPEFRINPENFHPWAHLSLHFSKCHIVGNHMWRLSISVF